jgi:hypothetical protein
MLSSTFSKLMGRDTQTLSPVGTGEAERLGLEGGGRLELKPLLAGEGVDHLLLLPLLAVVLLTLALSH